MSTSAHTINICLLALPDQESALLTRVIHFAKTQGKAYQLQETPELANIIVVSDQYDTKQWQDAYYIIRIATQAQHPSEYLLQPPLLITRVMRVLDDVSQQLQQAISPTFVAAESSIEVIPSHTPKDHATTEKSDPTYLGSLDTPNYLALVIDDSFAIRKQLEVELQSLGIQTHMAEDGETALSMNQQHHYDLIFLDIIMPGIDGYDVCKTLRQHERTRKTPIIMLSGKDSPLDEVKGVLAGATTYLTKPVKQERLAQTVKRVLSWLSEYAQIKRLN